MCKLQFLLTAATSLSAWRPLTLSRGGCYVQMMLPLPAGQRLGATLWLDGAPIHVRGIVVTRHPNFGNGIMFVGFDEESDKLLNRYIDKLIGR